MTGVSRYLGGQFARRLGADPSVRRVIGVDVVPPPHDIGRAEFVRADIRNPMIGKIIAQAEVDTVVHMNVIATPVHAGGRVSQKEINVIGTMQLLAACQRAAGVQRLVVRSSAAVYGSSSRDPAMFTEDMSAKRQPRSGYAKDVLEVEGYVRGFARRRPDVAVTTLRAADVVGPRVSTPLTDYFRLPVVPTALGYDARLQLLHESDLLAALHQAALDGVHGTFNLSGEGVLMLSQAIRRLGRATVPVPRFALSAVGTVTRQAGVRRLHAELSGYLTFGRGLDTGRMRSVLGFTPEHTTASAFADFGQAVGPGRDRSRSMRRTMATSSGAEHG